MKNISKKERTEMRTSTMREFLLSFFDADSTYDEKLINGFYLIKQFQKKIDLWVVAIYSKEAYEKKKQYKEKLRR